MQINKTAQKGKTSALAIIVGLLIVTSICAIYYFMQMNQPRQAQPQPTANQTQQLPSDETNTNTSVAKDRPLKDASLEKLIKQIEPDMEKSDLIKVFSLQKPEKITCEPPYSPPILCQGKKTGEVVEGYSIAHFLSEGTFVPQTVFEATIVEYRRYGPYKYLSSDIRTVDSISKDNSNYAEVSFANKDSTMSLVLVFMKENEIWALVNSYYGAPIEK